MQVVATLSATVPWHSAVGSGNASKNAYCGGHAPIGTHPPCRVRSSAQNFSTKYLHLVAAKCTETGDEHHSQRGAAQVYRADEFAATAGEDGRTACETCPLLLAAIGGEPSDETVVWQYAQADRRAVASGGIAGAVGAGKSIQSQEGTEECLTKPDGKVAASSWGLALPQSGPYPKPWARPKKINMRWNSWMGI